MTITIDLAGPSLSAFQQKADKLGVSVEQLARSVVEQYASGGADGVRAMSDATFRQAMADTFRENEELYRRLAK